MNVVIFKVNELGDSLAFVPVVQALRQLHPDWNITLITSSKGAELYGGSLAPQKIFACNKQHFIKAYRRPWVLLAWIFRVRVLKSDACLVSFDQGNCAHMIAKWSGAKIRVGGRLPYVKVGNSLTHAIPMPKDERPITWNWDTALALLKALGKPTHGLLSPQKPNLQHLLVASAPSKGALKRIVVHAGGSRDLTRWSIDRFAELACRLSSDFEIVWITHGSEGTPDSVVRFRQNTGSFAELAQWISSADLFVGNNSGPMHVADAIGVPGVAIAGLSPRGWDPYWNPTKWSILRHPTLTCAPCERIDRMVKECANLATPMACLDYWSVDRVESECRRALGRTSVFVA